MGINSSERDEKYEVNRWIEGSGGIEREREGVGERKGHTRVCVSAVRIINQLGERWTRTPTATAAAAAAAAAEFCPLTHCPHPYSVRRIRRGGVLHTLTNTKIRIRFEFKIVARETFCELYTLPRVYRVVQSQSSSGPVYTFLVTMEGRKRSVVEVEMVGGPGICHAFPKPFVSIIRERRPSPCDQVPGLHRRSCYIIYFAKRTLRLCMRKTSHARGRE